MNIRKAVITAAGPDQRHLPLQVVETRDGAPITVLQLLLEEVFVAGIEQIAVIVAVGDSGDYRKAAGVQGENVSFIEQYEPRGYGHAVSCAHSFVGDESFLLMVSDHLYLSRTDRSCVRQILDIAENNECLVSAVQATHESQLPLYGAVGGRRIPQTQDLYEVDTVLEKPSPTLAEQHLIVPGLRAGQYLCFFGMHVLMPNAMKFLEEQAKKDTNFGLNEMLCQLTSSEQYLAYQTKGQRFNLETDHGLLIAQLAFGLDGPKRDSLLTSIIELLATTR